MRTSLFNKLAVDGEHYLNAVKKQNRKLARLLMSDYPMLRMYSEITAEFDHRLIANLKRHDTAGDDATRVYESLLKACSKEPMEELLAALQDSVEGRENKNYIVTAMVYYLLRKKIMRSAENMFMSYAYLRNYHCIIEADQRALFKRYNIH